MTQRKQKSGFTLIELLVVLSIISLLSSVTLAAMNSARSKGRDAKRISDMKTMQKALELYYDQNGRYPLNTESNGTYFAGWVGTTPGCYNNVDGRIPANGLVSGGFLTALPQDPKPNPNCYLYLSSASGNAYKFLVYTTVENYSATYPLVDPGFGGGAGNAPCTNPPRVNSYSIYNDLGRCF